MIQISDDLLSLSESNEDADSSVTLTNASSSQETLNRDINKSKSIVLENSNVDTDGSRMLLFYEDEEEKNGNDLTDAKASPATLNLPAEQTETKLCIINEPKNTHNQMLTPVLSNITNTSKIELIKTHSKQKRYKDDNNKEKKFEKTKLNMNANWEIKKDSFILNKDYKNTKKLQNSDDSKFSVLSSDNFAIKTLDEFGNNADINLNNNSNIPESGTNTVSKNNDSIASKSTETLPYRYSIYPVTQNRVDKILTEVLDNQLSNKDNKVIEVGNIESITSCATQSTIIIKEETENDEQSNIEINPSPEIVQKPTYVFDSNSIEIATVHIDKYNLPFDDKLRSISYAILQQQMSHDSSNRFSDCIEDSCKSETVTDSSIFCDKVLLECHNVGNELGCTKETIKILPSISSPSAKKITQTLLEKASELDHLVKILTLEIASAAKLSDGTNYEKEIKKTNLFSKNNGSERFGHADTILNFQNKYKLPIVQPFKDMLKTTEIKSENEDLRQDIKTLQTKWDEMSKALANSIAKFESEFIDRIVKEFKSSMAVKRQASEGTFIVRNKTKLSHQSLQCNLIQPVLKQSIIDIKKPFEIVKVHAKKATRSVTSINSHSSRGEKLSLYDLPETDDSREKEDIRLTIEENEHESIFQKLLTALLLHCKFIKSNLFIFLSVPGFFVGISLIYVFFIIFRSFILLDIP